MAGEGSCHLGQRHGLRHPKRGPNRLNAKDGTVFHAGADDKGSSVLGKWTLKNDDAVLELGFVTGEGVEGVMKIRYVKKDENTLTVSLEGLSPQPIVYSLIKVKSAKEASRNAPYTPANPKRL